MERFLLVVGYRHELFYAHFSADSSIHFAIQDPVNGTGSAARMARTFASDQPFLLIFGDILADPADLRAMAQVLLDDPSAEAVVAVKHVDDPYQGAAVYEQDLVLTRFVEKPPIGTSTTNWNSAGIFGFRQSIFDELDALPLSPRGEYEMTMALVQMLDKGHRMLVYPLRGEWRDVGRPEDLEAAARLTAG